MIDNDPLYRLRHALAGLALALLLAAPTAALVGRWLGDVVGGGYGTRLAIYGVLMVYVLAGAAVLFAKVARHETRPLSIARVLRWFLSLWLGPALLRAARPRAPS